MLALNNERDVQQVRGPGQLLEDDQILSMKTNIYISMSTLQKTIIFNTMSTLKKTTTHRAMSTLKAFCSVQLIRNKIQRDKFSKTKWQRFSQMSVLSLSCPYDASQCQKAPCQESLYRYMSTYIWGLLKTTTTTKNSQTQWPIQRKFTDKKTDYLNYSFILHIFCSHYFYQ